MEKTNITVKECEETISLSDVEKARYNRFQNENNVNSKSESKFTLILDESTQIKRDNNTVSVYNTTKAVPEKSVFDRITRPITVKNTVKTADNKAQPVIQKTAAKIVTEDVQIKKNNSSVSMQNRKPVSVQNTTKSVFERITNPLAIKNSEKSVPTQHAEKFVPVPTQNAAKTITAQDTANNNIIERNVKNVTTNKDRDNKEKLIIDEETNLGLETKSTKDYGEVSGKEIEESTYSRVVIIGDGFLSNFSKYWPSESKIKPYILYKNKLHCDELFAKFSDHQFLKNSNKILVIFVLGLHDFAEYGTHVNSSCKGNHKLTEYLNKLTAVKGYATTLADVKKKFLINENLSVVFSYFPPFCNINFLSDIHHGSEVENLDCGCSLKDKKIIFDDHVKSDFTAITQIYQRLILNNQLNFVRECGIIEYMPPPISFVNGKWKIAKEGEKTVKDVAVLNYVINEFIFNTVCINDPKSLNFKEQFSTMRNLILKSKYRIALIGDKWLYSILRQWPGNFTGYPAFYITENLTFTDLRKAILSLFKSDEIGVVVATVPSGELFSTKSSKCVNHRPVEYPVPNENILKDPVNFAHQLIEKMNILIQDMNELRQNCRIFFTTSYPINFSSYYNHLSTTHFKTVGKKQHIDSSSIIDIEFDDFDTKIAQCTDMIDKYIQTANDEQMIPTCKISQAITSSGESFVFPTYIEDICPSVTLGKELFKYIKLYVGLFNPIQFDANKKVRISYPQKVKYVGQLHKLGYKEIKNESNKRPLAIDTSMVKKKVKLVSSTLKTDKKTLSQVGKQKQFGMRLSAHANVIKQGLLGDRPLSDSQVRRRGLLGDQPKNVSNRQGLLGDHPPNESQPNRLELLDPSSKDSLSDKQSLLGDCPPVDSHTNKKGLLGNHPSDDSKFVKYDSINDHISFKHKANKHGLLGDRPLVDSKTNRQSGLISKSPGSNRQVLLGEHLRNMSQTNRQELFGDHPSKDSLTKRQGLLGYHPAIDSQTNKKSLLGDHPSGDAKVFKCDSIKDQNPFKRKAGKQGLLGDRPFVGSETNRQSGLKSKGPKEQKVKSFGKQETSNLTKQTSSDNLLAMHIIRSLASVGENQTDNIQIKKEIGITGDSCSDNDKSDYSFKRKGTVTDETRQASQKIVCSSNILKAASVGNRLVVNRNLNSVTSISNSSLTQESGEESQNSIKVPKHIPDSFLTLSQDFRKVSQNIPDNPLFNSILNIIKSIVAEGDQHSESPDFGNDTNLVFGSSSGTQPLSQEARSNMNVIRSLDRRKDSVQGSNTNKAPKKNKRKRKNKNKSTNKYEQISTSTNSSKSNQGFRIVNKNEIRDSNKRGHFNNSREGKSLTPHEGRPPSDVIRSLALIGDRQMTNVDDQVSDVKQESRSNTRTDTRKERSLNIVSSNRNPKLENSPGNQRNNPFRNNVTSTTICPVNEKAYNPNEKEVDEDDECTEFISSPELALYENMRKKEELLLLSKIMEIKDYTEVCGAEIHGGKYTRVVIIGDLFTTNYIKLWPEKSNIKPYYIYKNKLSANELLKFQEHIFLKDSKKICLFFLLGLHDFSEYGSYLRPSCTGNHLFTEFIKELKVHDTVEYVKMLSEIKEKFEYNNKSLSVIFSYFSNLHNYRRLRFVFNTSDEDIPNCTCLCKKLGVLPGKKVESEFNEKINILNQVVMTKQIMALQDKRVFEYIPPSVCFINGNWKLARAIERTEEDIAVLNYLLNEFVYDVDYVNVLDQTKKFDIEEQVTSMRNRINQRKFRVVVIGDKWVECIASQWKNERKFSPFFYFADNLTLNDLQTAIISIVKSNEVGFVITSIPSGELFSIRKSTSCLEHNPLAFPIPNKYILENPILYSFQLIEKMNSFLQEIKKLRPNCGVVFTTCYPVQFASYYEHLTEIHASSFDNSIHIASTPIDLNFSDFDSKLSECTDIINKYIQTSNDVQKLTVCNISEVVKSSNESFVFPTFVENKFPQEPLVSELFKYIKNYIFSLYDKCVSQKLSVTQTQEEIKKNKRKYFSELQKAKNNSTNLNIDDGNKQISFDYAALDRNKRAKQSQSFSTTNEPQPSFLSTAESRIAPRPSPLDNHLPNFIVDQPIKGQLINSEISRGLTLRDPDYGELHLRDPDFDGLLPKDPNYGEGLPLRNVDYGWASSKEC